MQKFGHDKFCFEIDLKLKKNGKIILDLDTARLLYHIKDTGTILQAAHRLGISYSNAWNMLSKIEKNLGARIVKRHRGGYSRGATLLTELGIWLLDLYIKKLSEFGITIDNVNIPTETPDITIIGSDDSLLRILLNDFSKESGLKVAYETIGSLGGILHIVLRDADIVTAHMFDPDTGEYNLPYIRRFGLENEVYVLRGYKRCLVLAMKKLPSENIRKLILSCRTIATRGLGSGTRIFLAYICRQYNIPKLPKIMQFRTHKEAVRAVVRGYADACLAIEYEAKTFGLEYIKLAEEYFDFIIPSDKINLKAVKSFLDFLRENSTKISNALGYAIPQEFLSNIK